MKAGCFSLLALFLISFSAHANGLNIRVHQLTNASQADETRISAALELLEAVINTEEFKREVEARRYKQTSLSGKQVWNTIQAAAEELYAPEANATLDLNMNMYEEVSDTVGYTNPDDPFFHMNRYIHQYHSPAETAGNIFHEWLHKIGHTHSFSRWVPGRSKSVPYALGDLVTEMAAEIASKGDPVLKALQLENSDEKLNCLHH